MREREHLQEWVLGNPEILGPGVLIITSEFDRWESRSGAERDRLDILGLASDGHLVIAELKRDTAPETVEMQAIKYAAMASRFDSDVLAEAYVDFLRTHRDETLTNEEALDRLAGHAEFGLSDEALRAPRIVLVATRFPATVTATAVWLSEMGIDIRLTRIQAYRTAGEIVITVSQHYPPPDVEEFLVAPTRAARRPRAPDSPEVEWTLEDFVRLISEVDNVTIRATLDLCAEHADEWIPSEAVREVTGRETAKHRGDYGGFGVTLRTRFKRSNPPFQIRWAAGGTSQQYYRVGHETAELWQQARKRAEESPAVHDIAEKDGIEGGLPVGSLLQPGARARWRTRDRRDAPRRGQAARDGPGVARSPLILGSRSVDPGSRPRGVPPRAGRKRRQRRDDEEKDDKLNRPVASVGCQTKQLLDEVHCESSLASA